ncbi:thioredoxin-like protein [Atractiella rhizophila]|nr:thioredoxin-like protein [Atractiella rhizophila]
MTPTTTGVGAHEVSSVSEWNSILREARGTFPPRTVFVDFHATWCQPCKVIAPLYASLASSTPHAYFLRVDTDGPNTRAIAAAEKYKVSSIPTFVAISGTEVVDKLQGANQNGLKNLVLMHSTPKGKFEDETERLRKEGNDVRPLSPILNKWRDKKLISFCVSAFCQAFVAGRFEEAISLYTQALSKVPNSSMILSNRSFAHYRLATSVPNDPSAATKALEDAQKATELDPRWAKGWFRLAAAQLLLWESLEEVKKNGKAKTDAVANMTDALQKATSYGSGTKVEQEAKEMLERVKKL